MTHSLYHIKAAFYITYFHENYKPGRVVTVLSAESLLSDRHITLPDVRVTARDRTANSCEVSGTSNGIRLFDILVKQASLYQSLISYPQNKPTIFIVSYVPQFIYSNPGIGCCFFQTKITLFPNRDFFHYEMYQTP